MIKGYYCKETLLSWDLASVTLLAYQAWRELDHDAEYKPDWDAYVKLERGGHLKTYLVFNEELYNPVGVAVIILTPSLHTKGEVIALSDTLYVLPEHRGIGQHVVKWVTEELELAGVNQLVLSFHPDFDKDGKLPLSLGMAKSDNTYIKRLN